jgi:hypothetical protein
VTSFFGMNTADIRDMTRSQNVFWAVAIPLTATVLSIVLLTAFKGAKLVQRMKLAFHNLHLTVVRSPFPYRKQGLPHWRETGPLSTRKAEASTVETRRQRRTNPSIGYRNSRPKGGVSIKVPTAKLGDAFAKTAKESKAERKTINLYRY